MSGIETQRERDCAKAFFPYSILFCVCEKLVNIVRFIVLFRGSILVRVWRSIACGHHGCQRSLAGLSRKRGVKVGAGSMLSVEEMALPVGQKTDTAQ